MTPQDIRAQTTPYGLTVTKGHNVTLSVTQRHLQPVKTRKY